MRALRCPLSRSVPVTQSLPSYGRRLGTKLSDTVRPMSSQAAGDVKLRSTQVNDKVRQVASRTADMATAAGNATVDLVKGRGHEDTEGFPTSSSHVDSALVTIAEESSGQSLGTGEADGSPIQHTLSALLERLPLDPTGSADRRPSFKNAESDHDFPSSAYPSSTQSVQDVVKMPVECHEVRLAIWDSGEVIQFLFAQTSRNDGCSTST